MSHWLAHVLGLDSGSGPMYLFWSGFGANFGELAIVGALLAVVRRHNCHAKGCWRIARAPVDGTPWRTCWRHHPDGKPTHTRILALHRRARRPAYIPRRAAPGTGKDGERLYDQERDGL